MLHGLRRWVKITDSLLSSPPLLLLHEVIHVERESALRKASWLGADRVPVTARAWRTDSQNGLPPFHCGKKKNPKSASVRPCALSAEENNVAL